MQIWVLPLLISSVIGMSLCLFVSVLAEGTAHTLCRVALGHVTTATDPFVGVIVTVAVRARSHRCSMWLILF